MSDTFYPKSLLYSPGHKQSLFKKNFGEDVRVFDLEDSVPLGSKNLARENLQNLLLVNKPEKLAIRVNSMRTLEGIKDITCLAAIKCSPPYIIMSMVESPVEVEIYRNLLKEIKVESKLFVTIELPESLFNIKDLAAVADGMVFGSADYAVCLRSRKITWENMLFARYHIVNACANKGIPAIDTACYVLDDKNALIDETQKVKELGFHGKAAIYPSQIEIINEIFQPSEIELKQAQDVIDASEKNESNVSILNGNMIGPPFLKMAKQLIS